MHFCKANGRVIILTSPHYRGCRGLKLPSQGTLSPRADLLVEVPYLVLFRCPWMQNRAAACDGWEVRRQPCCSWGSCSDTEPGLLLRSRARCVPPGWLCVAGKSLCHLQLPGAEPSPSPPQASGTEVFAGKPQRWCCACPVAPTLPPRCVCDTIICLGAAVQFSGFGSVLQPLLILNRELVSK